AIFVSSRRRHTRSKRDWSSDVCSSDLVERWQVCSLLDQSKNGPGCPPPRSATPHIASSEVLGTLEHSHREACGWGLAPTYLIVRSEERRVGKECGASRSAVLCRNICSG